MYRNNQQSVFYNHKLEVHNLNGNNFDFQINILNTHPGDPMRRQVAEAVCIEEINPKLNRKEEWTTGRLMSKNFAHENLPQNTRVLSYKWSGDHVTYPISPQASRSLNCLSANHQFPASPDYVSHKMYT